MHNRQLWQWYPAGSWRHLTPAAGSIVFSYYTKFCQRNRTLTYFACEYKHCMLFKYSCLFCNRSPNTGCATDNCKSCHITDRWISCRETIDIGVNYTLQIEDFYDFNGFGYLGVAVLASAWCVTLVRRARSEATPHYLYQGLEFTKHEIDPQRMHYIILVVMHALGLMWWISQIWVFGAASPS